MGGGQDIERGVGGGAGCRAGNGGRWGGGHVLDDMEQVVGVSSQLSVVGLVSVWVLYLYVISTRQGGEVSYLW